MKTVEMGDKIQISCEGKLQDGQVFLKNEENKHISLTVGENALFPALEKELIGMKVGESKNIILEPQDSFGNPDPGLIMETSKDNLNPDISIEIGCRIGIDLPTGKKLYGLITEMTEDKVTVDFNHPLAGKTVIFTVTLIAIEDPLKSVN
ncbi:MAG: FKBP-type peptidyl-prolyl cis-trans isomerase [Candidatus Thermoplasmatota archaeon]|nr:FKBP-type peptidyl-prolyl cis-trans isomerase [Candidatus Thermoplasmatota archaeon]